MRYALFPMPYALFPMPYSQSYLIFLIKAIYIHRNQSQAQNQELINTQNLYKERPNSTNSDILQSSCKNGEIYTSGSIFLSLLHEVSLHSEPSVMTNLATN
jgi:hypothetical protein